MTFNWTSSTTWSDAEGDLSSTVLNNNALDYGIKYIEKEITVGGARTATVTFQYTSGNCALNTRGVEVLNQDGVAVAGDYHVGKTGTNSTGNVYTVSVAKAGTYTVRLYVTFGANDRANATNGNITVAFAAADAADFSHNVTFAAEYATLYLGYQVAIPEGVEAYVVESTSNSSAHLEKVEGVIPANTGVILKNLGEATARYTFAYTDAEAAVIKSNLLDGSIADRYVAANACVLSNGANGIGLYGAILNQLDGTAFLNNANKAYLPNTAGANLTASFYGFDWNGTTAIENVEVENASNVIYDLTGRRVETIGEAGIYIVNGKKVLVK
jgi:hypothetical protein